jgi:hypothetical protein
VEVAQCDHLPRGSLLVTLETKRHIWGSVASGRLSTQQWL